MILRIPIIPVLAIYLLIDSVIADRVWFRDCGSRGKVIDLRVDGCSSGTVCPLKRGSSNNIEIDFEPRIPTTTLTASAYTVFMGLEIPLTRWRESRMDVCSNIKDSWGVGGCPLEPSTIYTYDAFTYIPKFYPSLPTTVRWRLNDERGDSVACVQVVTRITSATSSGPPSRFQFRFPFKFPLFRRRQSPQTEAQQKIRTSQQKLQTNQRKPRTKEPTSAQEELMVSNDIEQ